MSIQANKQQALSAALSQIERQFGKGAVMRLGDSPREPIPSISTGSLNLDIALGIGGLPRGRIVEIFGPESSGKTTLTLSVIAQAQKEGKTCAFIDAEHALDPDYAAKLGVIVDDLLVSQPDTGEQALEIADMLVRSRAVDVLIIDSVAALVPKAEIEGEMGDSHIGVQARLMSQALRKITGNIKESNCLAIFINQIRMKIGVMFGSPETTTGGNALKFYASVRLDIRRTGAVKEGDNVIGNETRVKVIKNKVAPPFREAEFQILYGEGICKLGELIDLGVTHGIIEKAGAWYSYNGEKVGQGKNNVKSFLRENPSAAQSIEASLRSKLLPSRSPAPVAVESSPAAAPSASPAFKSAPASPQFVPARSQARIEVGESPATERPLSAEASPQRMAGSGDSVARGQIVSREIGAAVSKAPEQTINVSQQLASSSWFERALEQGILEQKHAWIMYKGNTIGRGRDVSRDNIEADPVLKAEILAQLSAVN